MHVEVWLRKLGLEQYEAAFRDNAIDDQILPRLTAEDLRDLGVGSVGHRRKLLDAIAALRADIAAKAPAAEPDPSASDGARRDSAERRQITVMFSDLVGSTALSARMDPEDLRQIIAAYQDCVARIVRRFGGFVAQYLGDGVLIYFGYPQAHEDDAERAVRAGLELASAVAALETPIPLQTRAGIATGLVVVGDLIGPGAAREYSVIGETPNLAARLQATAEPNMVVIAESTRRLLGNLFELKDLGSKHLKGTPGPVRAWAALRASSVASRFEALHASSLSALVGREEETELLMRRWLKAKAGEGQVVLLSGEAGIGKSRLAAALLQHLGAEPHARLRYFCSPQHTESALYPIIGQIERAARLAYDDTTTTKLDKVDALWAQSATPIEDAALFAELLSLPNDGRYPVLDLAPQQRRQKTLEALLQQVKTMTRKSPVLIVLEDSHWADPTTLELFGRAVGSIAKHRVLLIVTFRSEFAPLWSGQPHVTTLSLNRLAQREVGAMIDGLVGNNPIPPGIRQDIIERTDGIPLFVEEMTKAVLEAEGDAVARVTAMPSPAAAVPASLHASLMARLDRLGPSKELAQIGAAIGREFSHALLAAVVDKPEAELDAALDRLMSAGLLFRQGIPPYATYLFKHALVQDAAYGTLLREPRRALHARIAEILESEFPEMAESQPELLARHCSEAGLIDKAASFWGKAGQRSLDRSALAEATAQLCHALDQITALPSTAALRREEIKLQVALITPLIHVKGFAAPETKAAAERARLLIERVEALGEPLENPLLWFSVLYGFWAANLVAFNGDALRHLAAQFLTLAEKQGATVPLMIGHRLVGTSLLCTGNTAAGRTHLDRALALYDPTQHRALTALFGQDSRVSILSYRSWALWMLGYPQSALADSERALAEAREIGQAATLMNTVALTSLIHIFCGNYAAAAAQSDEAIALAEEKGALLWKAFGTMNHGCVLALTGKAAKAVQTLKSAIAAWRSTGATVLLPLNLSLLARAHAELGQLEEAWRCIGEATTAIATTKEMLFGAEVNRLAGEIALLSPRADAEKAQDYFERALAVAREQEAKSWELRAATSLARLWLGQGKRTAAYELIAPVYGWFSEGFDTHDLKEAKAVLTALA